MNPRLLLVDDDSTLLQFMREFLQEEGFQVEAATSGRQALRRLYDKRPDLVVLDIMMPGMDGWEVCARIRELSQVPVIFLTAKDTEADKLRGFRLGVDDYVTKPFSLAELAARIRAVLQRTRPLRAERELVYDVGSLRVDQGRREAFLGGERLNLTETEFRLLAALARRAGEAISRQTLAEEVWGPNRMGMANALRRYVWLLRRKIEEDPRRPQRLVTVRGYGYRLESDLSPD
jgi:two-component system KDP operon response regulator KdpE